MRHTWQKHLAGLLAVIMLFSLLPVTASAAEIGAPTVTIRKTSESNNTSIDADTPPLEFPHNGVWQLNVSANFSSVTNGKIKIAVAPGLKINSYYGENSGSDSSSYISEVKTSTTKRKSEAFQNYTFPVDFDTVEYTVSSGAATVNVDLTLSVDTVLWPNINEWKIDDAITVEFSGDDAALITRTANVTVNRATDQTNADWNRVHISDPNSSVPAATDKDFSDKDLYHCPQRPRHALRVLLRETDVHRATAKNWR